MPARNVAVFVPVYNEREMIGNVLERLLRIAGDHIGLLVVADDGSTDGSDEIAAKYAHHVIKLAKNAGNGATTRAALRYIAGTGRAWDAVVRLDGDGQHDPALLPDVLSKLANDADVVVCSRFHPRSDFRRAMLDRQFLNESAARWMRAVTGWPVTDARSGFLGFRWSALSPVIGNLRTERYGIPMELLLRVWQRNAEARYAEIPHPAMYQPGISVRLDRKYADETAADKVERMTEAYRVFLATCMDLNLL